MKRGFTLIELLAVIVILAIIAVIAVPIVLNIIDETKDNATLRSADFYLDAVELSVAQATLKDKNITDDTYNLKDGDICLNETCTEVLEVEVNGSVPESGTITITNGNVSYLDIYLNEKRIIKNSVGKIIYFPCELVSDTGVEGVTPGDKYVCEVKEGIKYTFYVLNQAIDGTTNLIMNSNICEDGTLPTDDKQCYCYWGLNNNSDYPQQYIYGPTGALKSVNIASSTWENLIKIKINTFEVCNSQGTGCETKTMEEYEGYARIPYPSEINNYDRNTHAYNYLYDGMIFECRNNLGTIVDCENAEYITGVDGPDFIHITTSWGYWLAGVSNQYYGALNAGAQGSVWETSWGDYAGGIRPVINIKL